MRKNLTKELLIIGGTTTALGVPLYLATKKILDKEPNALQVAGIMFATGAILHLLYEVTGGNKFFCEMYLDSK
jgi:hypothetical protein